MKELAKLVYKYSESVSEKLLLKKFEDGIIEKLDTASVQQLEKLKRGYKFKYYDKEEAVKLIDKVIIKVTRREKMKQINERV